MKRIVVACGQGSCTSKVVATKIENYLREKGIRDVSVTHTTIGSIAQLAKDGMANQDVLVTTTPVQNLFGLNNIIGTPLLTGINTDKIYKQIMEALEKCDE